MGSPILITEYDPGAPDALEIQNVTGSDIVHVADGLPCSEVILMSTILFPQIQTLSRIMV